MKTLTPAVLVLGLVAQSISPSASAFPGLGGLIAADSPQLLNLKFPLAGTVGNISLATLDLVPGLAFLNLPVIHTFGGVPILGSITLAQGENLFSSLKLLQAPLPGLTMFGK